MTNSRVSFVPSAMIKRVGAEMDQTQNRFIPEYDTNFQRWLITDKNGSFPFSTILELTEDQAQRICDIMNEKKSKRRIKPRLPLFNSGNPNLANEAKQLFG